jgi:galactokinase
MTDLGELTQAFDAMYRAKPALFRAPGRVNLIGEHTDYNQGLAMPAALQFDTTIAIARHAQPRLRVRSRAFDDGVEIPLHDRVALQSSRPRGHWSDYVTGVVLALWRHGVSVVGADLLIASDIPLGSGLSSSASFEVGIALALAETSDRRLDPLTLATLCQQAENDYVGMRCGIMDQFAAAFGRAGHALTLDCRSLAHRLVPLGGTDAAASPGAALVVCNSMVRHAHAGGEYNRRRAECEQAVSQLARTLPHVGSLRDVSLDELVAHGCGIDPVVFRRARHVVSENERVVQAEQALRGGDWTIFGELMRSSHRSLRDDYEVSCPELDAMVSIADDIEGVFGSRMTGGGFGGCTVSWLRVDVAEAFAAEMLHRYATATGRQAEIYLCTTADGAARIGAQHAA